MSPLKHRKLVMCPLGEVALACGSCKNARCYPLDHRAERKVLKTVSGAMAITESASAQLLESAKGGPPVQ